MEIRNHSKVIVHCTWLRIHFPLRKSAHFLFQFGPRRPNPNFTSGYVTFVSHGFSTGWWQRLSTSGSDSDCHGEWPQRLRLPVTASCPSPGEAGPLLTELEAGPGPLLSPRRQQDQDGAYKLSRANGGRAD